MCFQIFLRHYVQQNHHQGNTADVKDLANSIFKKAFTSTISEYITEKRISNAKRKLATINKSITKIEYECGFNTISRFNEAFRKMNNCTPREFRKMISLRMI